MVRSPGVRVNTRYINSTKSHPQKKKKRMLGCFPTWKIYSNTPPPPSFRHTPLKVGDLPRATRDITCEAVYLHDVCHPPFRQLYTDFSDFRGMEFVTRPVVYSVKLTTPLLQSLRIQISRTTKSVTGLICLVSYSVHLTSQNESDSSL